ncbi:helix-turn-helix transcriptional regulator [uncultured Chryseobacterium sp.]|uniref:helix-turn-helix domain-containing protein n=1 Tax=uncultured Chryseobacterium sp. TaxID=259322 RepID=UPI0025FA7A25|nr:helix-turn-helix transcriptional regulator [uncultured Chryseobacterium sp.]
MTDIDRIKFLEHLGNQIKKLRKERGLSLRQLAQLCDIDYSDISKIEKGQRNIQISTLLELTRGLDIHPKDLFDFKTDVHL